MARASVVFGLGRRAATVILALGLTVSAASCASKYGSQTVQVKHYSDCYAPIAQLRKDEATKTSNTVAGAVAGTLIGAVIGYSQDGGRGAVIGGVSGAIIGGSAAYLITDQIQKKNQAERFAAYSAALEADIQGLSNAVAAAKLVNKCYENSYNTLKRQYKAGQIGKEEMTVRLKELRDGTNDANVVLAKFAAEIAQNQVVYQDIQKSEIQKGASDAQLAVFKNNEQQAEQKQSELQHELQRMKTISSIMESDYQTIHADTQVPRLAALPAAICPKM
jgi:outer membrane lipoprotein SlyB